MNIAIKCVYKCKFQNRFIAHHKQASLFLIYDKEYACVAEHHINLKIVYTNRFTSKYEEAIYVNLLPTIYNEETIK